MRKSGPMPGPYTQDVLIPADINTQMSKETRRLCQERAEAARLAAAQAARGKQLKLQAMGRLTSGWKLKPITETPEIQTPGKETT